MRLLIVDDEVTLAESMADGLRNSGFEVDVVHTGTEGLLRAVESPYHAIVLDVLLPGMNGYAVCREIRARGVATPILMLTAKLGEYDEAEGLDLGADDFLRKPFSFVVLVARLNALIRRGVGAPTDTIVVGAITIDVTRRRCERAGVPLAITSREFDVLVALARRGGGLVRRRELVDEVWGFDFDGDTNIVDVYIRYLRRKVDHPFDQPMIETVRSMGYRLVDPRVDAAPTRKDSE